MVNRTSFATKLVLLLVLVTTVLETGLAAGLEVLCAAESHHSAPVDTATIAHGQWSEHASVDIASQSDDHRCCVHLPVSAIASTDFETAIVSAQLDGMYDRAVTPYAPDPPRRPPKAVH